jgi:hypothetical protein
MKSIQADAQKLGYFSGIVTRKIVIVCSYFANKQILYMGAV